MLNKVIVITGWVLLLWPGLLGASEQAALKIAVLPCEVFSMQENTDLGREVADKLSKRLAINPAIVVAEGKDVLAVVRENEYSGLNQQRLKEIARLLSANFVLFGSITKIRSEISIDVQMYSSFESSDYFKTFAEGVELKIVLENIASRVEQALMSKAALIPPSQRPRIQVPPQAAPLSKRDTFDLDSELAETLAEPQKELKRPADAERPVATPVEPQVKDLEEADPETGNHRPAPQEGAVVPEEAVKAGTVAPAQAVPAAPETAAPAVVSAAAQKKSKRDKKQSGREFFEGDKPININSDSMEYDNKKNRAVFNGNVVARQGDFVIFADKMRVVYSESGGLKQVRALGQVKIIQGERIATGKEIVFYNDEQKIVASGNPRVWQGDNVVYGNKITIFLKEDRSVVDGGPESRASATIYPKKKKSKSD